MKDALWNYWIAREAPLGLDLPIYSAAVESVKAAWFRSEKSKVKGGYIAKKRFDNLLGEALALAEQALKDEQHGDRMMRRLRGCFQMGPSEQLDYFLEELNLRIGPRELAAIKARHSPAHGGGAVGERTKLHLHSVTYKVLFELVFLKLLNYDGSYVDRATVGFPVRDLDEPIGS